MNSEVVVNGRVWKLYDVNYETSDGKFSFSIYAISSEHAEAMLDDIKSNAYISGEIIGNYRAR